jgi:hypothetical protein
MEKLTNLEINKEDLENLSAEELVDLKIELEELIMKCEDLLNEEV